MTKRVRDRNGMVLIIEAHRVSHGNKPGNIWHIAPDESESLPLCGCSSHTKTWVETDRDANVQICDVCLRLERKYRSWESE